MSDLAELFERDPLSLTREDRDKIVARLREARNQFQLGVKTAGKTTKPKKSVKEILDINRDDLEI